MEDNQTKQEEQANRDGTVVSFYNRCCKSADIKRDWNTLSPMEQIHFTEAVRIIHQIVYNGR